MASIRRLRSTHQRAGFAPTIEYHSIIPGSGAARALADAIRRLRKAESLPLPGDTLVEFWGAERCWAHPFTQVLWLYYRCEDQSDGVVVLMAVHDHVHQQ